MKYRFPSKDSYPKDFLYVKHYWSYNLLIRWAFLKRLEIALELSEGLPTGEYILEVGAGPGFLFPTLAERASIIDLDLLNIGDHDFQAARSMTSNEHIENKVTFMKGDILSLPFKDESFELIFCTGLLEHVPVKAIEELYRVLEYDGYLIVAYPVETVLHWMARQVNHLFYWWRKYPLSFRKFPTTHKEINPVIQKFFHVDQLIRLPHRSLPDILSFYEILRVKKVPKA